MGTQEMAKMDALVLICQSHRQVEEIIKKLRKSSCDLRKLSVVGMDRHAVDEYLPPETRKKATETVSFWCKMWNSLQGDAFMNVPAFGSVLIAGPLAQSVTAAWSNLDTFENLTPLGVSLHALGISRESIPEYLTALKAGGFLLVLRANAEKVAGARKLLGSAAGVGPLGIVGH
jgi:hypothetical protein